jgi:FkbM family methyltransferase
MKNTLKRLLPPSLYNYARRLRCFLVTDPNAGFLKQLTTFVETEPEVTLLPRFIPEDGVCVDIGANIGLFSYHMATLAPRGQVHCFEPRSDLIETLKRNLANFSNIVPRRLAVSDFNGPTRVTVDPTHGLSTTVKELAGAGLRKQAVEAVRLDDYCANFDRVDFIKIDVEGNEMRVIDGSRNTLRKHRPVVMCESVMRDLRPQGRSVYELFSMMSAVGYNTFFLYSGRLIPATRAHAETNMTDDNLRIFNWVFLPNEKIGARLSSQQ